ncbi:uncharacterized protein At1g03900-like [Coffea arabica]|uniref:Uncharacterized protein At1g03900-like n=1 Tax=Coffea arabica TaxID=13443 RepID=A0ABM4U414_COFAR
MLSAAGLSSGHPGTVKAKTLNLAPPRRGRVRIRSPLLPPPNDSAATRMTSGSHNTTLKGPKEVARHSTDPLADLSQPEVSVCGGRIDVVCVAWVPYICIEVDTWQFGL